MKPVVIKKEEIDGAFYDKELISQWVFLEKADKPSSSIAHNIPTGLLLLTNKHLLFLSRESSNEKKKAIKEAAVFIAEGISPSPGVAAGAALIELITKKLKNKKSDEEYFNQYLNSEHSFIAPVEQIVSCEKFGRNLTFNPKKKFVRIGIIDKTQNKTNYCIYHKQPGNWLPKAHELWEKAIKLVAPNIS